MSNLVTTLPVYVQRAVLARQFADSVSFEAYEGRSDVETIHDREQAAHDAWGRLLETTDISDRLSVKAFIKKLFEDESQKSILSVSPDSLVCTLNRHLIFYADEYGIDRRRASETEPERAASPETEELAAALS